MVGKQLDLRLVLLRASHVVLARSVIDGCRDRRLELREVELLDVARKDERPHAFDILCGQNIAHLEVGLGILVLGQPLVEGGSGITLHVLRHSGTHAKQGTGNDQQTCQRHVLAPRCLSHPRFDRHNLSLSSLHVSRFLNSAMEPLPTLSLIHTVLSSCPSLVHAPPAEPLRNNRFAVRSSASAAV